MNNKEHAHQLIDRLEPEQINAVVHLLEAIIEDEAASQEDHRRYLDGLAAFSKGSGIPMEEVLAEFGFTLEDFPLKK